MDKERIEALEMLMEIAQDGEWEDERDLGEAMRESFPEMLRIVRAVFDAPQAVVHMTYEGKSGGMRFGSYQMGCHSLDGHRVFLISADSIDTTFAAIAAADAGKGET